MKKIIFLLVLFPLLSFGQPFKVLECKVRPINVNGNNYTDIHIALLSKKDSGYFTIDSLQYNSINSSSVQLSIKGKHPKEKKYLKNDTLVLQCNIGAKYIENEGEIILFYHNISNARNEKRFVIKKTRILKKIDFQQY